MNVCQVNQEQELLTALFVNSILGVSKTKTEDLAAISNYKSIAQKSAGLYAQLYMLNAKTVVRRLKLLQARINSTAIWFVEIKDINIKKLKNVVLGRVIEQVIQQNISGLLQSILNPSIAMIVGVVEYLLSGRIYRESITENEMIGVIYAKNVTLSTTKIDTQTSSGTKYVDVIRKRYAKFISPDNQLPENWEELTKEITVE